MKDDETTTVSTNGVGAAAVLATAIAGLTLGLLALVGDAVPGIAQALNIWTPTGPLSGVTSFTVVIWLVTWVALTRRWSGRNVNFTRINLAAAILLGLGSLLIFPPFMDLLQGK